MTKNKLSFKNRMFLIVVTIMIICCLKFGYWQYNRLEWKNNLIEKVELSKATAPAELNLDDFDSERDLFKRIYAEGEFINTQEMYLSGKYLNEAREKAEIGVHVMTPFRLKNGDIILVNRGWVPQEKRDHMERPESSVDGIVRLEGVVRETKGSPPWYMPANMPGKNVWFWLDIPQMIKFLNKQGIKNIKPVLIQQTNHTVKSGELPKLLNADFKFYNEHMTYIYTWLGLALVLIIMLVIWYFRVTKVIVTPIKK